MPAKYQLARNAARNARAAVPIGPGLQDLVALAGRWDANVEFLPMDPDLSGFIIKEEDTDPRIYINAAEPLHRQRFTLAHEIGHLVERQSVAGDQDYSFTDYRSNAGYDLHEFFADEFAGELLMPAEPFIQSLQRGGKVGASVEFNVSIPAVQKRIERLIKNPPES
ncbi:hypothetical protein CJ203_04380 [Corynebacterium tuscaniense]|uniref:IrrE N-terminal-like domain-containing protein n=1 Tax=Corynebacterium tuscaniense TaxID=302449 RepID=A0A2N6T5I1_9CORY|nr:ImmA/IrrE family metallo-endopeptidase [Corynebacterium tuscaniense]PMC64562.1 hypothetical protein CJ203_04380 [Corynebacterium tuscaniense]